MEFKILKKSKRSRARLGRIVTPHGEVETPALVTVATQASVKTLTNEQARAAGSRLLINNTLHLHLRPGEQVIRKAGGLHRFMGWDGPLMTDSGGYQVFSLGFGRDHGIGKVLKSKTKARVKSGEQPSWLKITEEGVHFTSYVDGRRLFMSPEDSIRIQEALGADIVVAFDECTSPVADAKYTRLSMERTHRWAERCLKARTRGDQAMYGVVQGGRFSVLRRASARTLASMDFEGFGIGGEFGDDKSLMSRMISWVVKELPDDKPRHLLGIGHPEDIRHIIREGVDTFDCTVPTQYARHGVAFTSRGRLDLTKSVFLTDRKPLDARCSCFVCQEHSRAYLSHLVRAKEITGLALLTFHNLYWFNALVAEMRGKIKRGEL
ncbi:MAG: tRNA guanosine(34) transglycosylase Tgt [Patescibacteria group bacterium]|nr:tRNA guanosine(34) transglycosylase Tgt [Patescibacteria group bacterium]